MALIGLEPLFRMTVAAAGAPYDTGVAPIGYERRMVCVSGGTFEGDRLRGEVLPGGSDCLVFRPDGAMQLDVRLALRTDQGETIYMAYTGRRHGPAEVMQRYRTLGKVEAGEDYFRVSGGFETGSERLTWLNNIVVVGTGYRLPSGPVYDFFEIT